MIKTIDMKHMRYINLFEKVSGVHPKHCFVYNSAIVFVVPKNMLAKVIRDSGRDIKEMSEILGRKIKVAILPNGLEDAEEFISEIIRSVCSCRKRRLRVGTFYYKCKMICIELSKIINT